MPIQWTILMATFAVIALVEINRPLIGQSPDASTHVSSGLTQRWLTHFALFVGNGYLQRGVAAVWGGWVLSGLPILPVINFSDLPVAAGILVGVVILDLAHYGFHRLQHRLPFLWRFHRIHHAQSHLDLTSGWVFHPVEAIFSSLITISLAALLGLSATSVALFYSLAGLFNLYEHGNYQLPRRVDSAVAFLFNTPGLHHTHHSLDANEFGCNFGVLLSVWDRLFGSLSYAHTENGLPIRYGCEGIDLSNKNAAQILLAPFQNR